MSSGEVFTSGATTSQHIEAEDDDHFENTTFQLKRTRSMGLLDEFIQPTTPSDGQQQSSNDSSNESNSSSFNSASLSSNEVHNTANSNDHTTHQVSASPHLSVQSPEITPHDDTDLQEEPSIHVDYLSHEWDVSDISKSWRYIIQKKRDVADSARLENASWRTWAQRRSNLKTISPEVVNWSKESDVTWLYGPIVKDEDHHDNEEDDHKRVITATSATAGDLSLPSKSRGNKIKGPKPILKRRTVEESIISHSNLLKLQLAENRLKQERERQIEKQQQIRLHQKNSSKENEVPEFNDFEAISDKLNSQYNNSRNNSSTSLNSQYINSNNNSSTNLNSKNSYSEIKESLGTLTLDDKQNPQNNQKIEVFASNSSPSNSKIEKHIHFNDEVQQCIAINISDEENDFSEDYDTDDYDYDDTDDYIYESNDNQTRNNELNDSDDSDEGKEGYDEEDDEEGGFFLKVRSPSHGSMASTGVNGMPSMASASSLPSVKSPKSSSLTSCDQTSESTHSSSHKYKTIHILPSTTLNHGSSDEESDEENPYTSSLSHNVNNSSKRYDHYYDYNSVYTVDSNQAIYGTLNNSQNSADIVDVPENIALGSGFDYEAIDKLDASNYGSMPIIDPVVINSNNVNYGVDSKPDSTIGAGTIQDKNDKSTPFELSSSDDDSDSDDGLSISTKNSSQSLAQSVFGGNMTALNSNNNVPVESTLNNGGSGLFKQPTSSNSLSSQFFGGEMTKSKGSSSALSESFFNISKPEPISVSPATQQHQNPAQTQRKASPLPPHTTSANAFSGNSTPPPPPQGNSANNTFMLDSGSESEDEFIEDASGDNAERACYTALSHVAGANGIRSPSPEVVESNKNQNIVGQAKGLATSFLGNWKSNETK